MSRHSMLFCLFAPVLLLAGCNLPGKPGPEPEVPRPEAVLSFDTLYGNNCAACHGAKGQEGAAADLANPEYQTLVDDTTLYNTITGGEKGTMMPAFGQKHGGELTDAQIGVLIQGMRARWRKDHIFGTDAPPPLKANHAGDPAQGQHVYAIACARCHGETAQKPGKAGSILDGSYLALINEQTVRNTILAGRPDIGQPDWRGQIQGRALTDDEISNVTAWLMAQKPANPGQPYATSAPKQMQAQPPANAKP